MDKFRAKIVQTFDDIYKKNKIKNHQNIAIETEKYIFAKYPIEKFDKVKRSLYYHKVQQLLSHLMKKGCCKNTELIKSIKKGQIHIKDLPNMTPRELFPSKWKPLEDRIELERKNDIDNEHAIYTNQFTCRRCNKSKCTYYQLQTRGGDESITTFVACTHCGNHWRC